VTLVVTKKELPNIISQLYDLYYFVAVFYFFGVFLSLESINSLLLTAANL